MTLEFSGIHQIDSQHFGLFEVILTTRKAVANGTEFAGLLTLLSKLEDYTEKHFETEEKILAEQNYFDYENQKIQHRAFKKAVHQYIEDLKITGEPPLAILDFVEMWLTNHINEEAVLFKKYINAPIGK